MAASQPKSQLSLPACAEWGLLLAAISLFTVTKQYRPYVLVGLVFLAIAFLLRRLRMGHFLPRTGLEIPALLFVASAAVATWIAFDKPTALLQFARILAAASLFYAVVESRENFRAGIAALFVLAASGLALYWPLQHDFSAETPKLTAIKTIGEWLTSHFPAPPGPSIQNNIAAGTLALALPFGAALIMYFRQRRRTWLAVFFGLSEAMIAGGLFLTGSRGAWAGVLGGAGLIGLAWIQRRWFASSSRRTGFWAVIICLGLILIVVVMASGKLSNWLGQIPDPTGTLQGRAQLWKQGLPLVRDYLFTGCGLMSFRMVFSMYGALVHIPFYEHLHNTLLELWLEQGILGLAAVLWGTLVIAACCRRALGRSKVLVWEWAGLAALAIAGIHGLFDAVFYVGRSLPLFGLALGFACTAGKRMNGRWQENKTASSFPRKSRVFLLPYRFWAITLAVLLIFLAVFFRRSLLSAWYANVGAISHARMELSLYDPYHFDDPTMDLVRRTADLSRAETRFQKSLRWDHLNATALQRLSEIALSRGQYDRALAWMHSAWESGRRDDVTRLLLSDALVAAGRPEAAADLVRGLTGAEKRLMFQAWYRYWTGVPPGCPDYRRAADAWQAVLMINPGNEEAARWKSLAERR